MNIDDLTAFAKSRGMFWPSAEIYGGASGLYDYGDVGATLKRRFEAAWLAYFVDTGRNCHLVDGSTLLPEAPLVHSGHASRFNDVVIGCGKCKTYYRADVLLNELGIKISEGATAEKVDNAIKENKVKCQKCKSAHWLPAKAFNMMIDVSLGPERGDKGYLRPETAQSTYLNFSLEFNILRKTLPLGLAIIGKAYRNEISPRQGLFRMRELTQAELQLFFDPENWNVKLGDLGKRQVNVHLYGKKENQKLTLKELVEKHDIPEFYAYHMGFIDAFYKDVLGVPHEKIRFMEKGGDEKAFYNKVHMDIEVDIESWGGIREVGGLHYRGDYDLTQHKDGSKQDLSVKIGDRDFIPHVLELSFGVDRNIWMLIDVFYTKEGDRSVLKIPNFIAPYHLAIFSLQKEKEIDEMVEHIYKKLRPHFKIFLDSSGSIGRRYARMDEIGTPFCITVDYDSVKKGEHHNTVTVRSRDDKKQVRIKIDELESFISSRVSFDPYKAFNFE